MIKMIYEGEHYNFDGIGSQPYDIKTEIVMNEDASADEVIAAAIKLLTVASYTPTKRNLLYAIEKYCEENDLT